MPTTEVTYDFPSLATGDPAGITDAGSAASNTNGVGFRVDAADGTIWSVASVTGQEQWVEVVATIANDSTSKQHEFGCVIRSTNTASAGYYIAWSRISATLGAVTIYETSSFTQLAQVLVDPPTNGSKKLRAEAKANGSSVRLLVYVDTQSLPTLVYDDASPSTGSYVGMAAYSPVAAGGGVSDVTITSLTGGLIAEPMRPTNVRVGQVRNQAVPLSWVNPPGTSTGRVVEYAAQSYPGQTVSWTEFENSSTTTNSVVVTGLTNGTRYIFRVAMKNATGTGVWGYSESGATPKNRPYIIGTSTLDVSTGATVQPTYPAGYTAVADDYVIILASGRPTGTTAVSTPGSYSLLASVLQEVGANDLRLQAFGKVLTTSEALPSISLPAEYQGTSAGLAVQTVIVRGLDTTTPVQVSAVTSSAAAAATFRPTGLTTTAADALVLSVVTSADDNTLIFDATTSPANDQAFTLNAANATTTGGDLALAVASRIGAVPALSTQASAPDNLTAVFQPDTTPTDTGDYQYRRDGTGARVFVLDSGFRTSHNEFTGRVEATWVPTGTGWSATNDTASGDGHGTIVLSIAAGDTLGVARNASMVAMKVHNSSTPGTSPIITHAVEALEWIVANYDPPYFVNWSMIGFDKSVSQSDYDTMKAAMDTFAAAGGIMIVAAGNENTHYTNYMPDSHPAAYVVGGIVPLTGAKDSNSSFAPDMKMWAPYTVTGATKISDSSTATESGTSESAPMVCGLIATIWGADQTLTAAQAADLAISGATKDTLTGIPLMYPNLALYTNCDVPGLIGSVTAPMFRESTLGNDAWAGFTIALNTAPPPAQNFTGSDGTIAVTATSGSFTPGEATWTGSAATVTITATVGSFTASGNWTGSDGTVGVTATVGSFIPGSVTWTLNGATVIQTATSGSFSGTGMFTGSDGTLTITATSGTFTPGSVTWSGTAATVTVTATVGSFSNVANLTWTTTQTGLSVSASTGSFSTSIYSQNWPSSTRSILVTATSGKMTLRRKRRFNMYDEAILQDSFIQVYDGNLWQDYPIKRFGDN